jgi:hypothetical protein
MAAMAEKTRIAMRFKTLTKAFSKASFQELFFSASITPSDFSVYTIKHLVLQTIINEIAR